MDLDKLTVGGHSFGGMSSVYTAFREERVKAVFGFDAWIWSVLSKTLANKFIIKQHQYQIVTEKFSPLVEEAFNYNQFTEIEREMKASYVDAVKRGVDPPN